MSSCADMQQPQKRNLVQRNQQLEKPRRKRQQRKRLQQKKKKPAAKKAKPKKKAVKKVVKKKKAKKPVKPVRPKVRPLPSPRGLSGFVVYLQTQLKSSTGPDGAGRLKAAVASWKSLSDAEQETYKTRAATINATRKQAYASAISRMSPTEIKEENTKRRLLAKKYKQKTNTRIIKDPNAPKRPLSGYLRFSIENRTPGAPVAEAAKESGQRWRAMSVAEKQPYQQAADADLARYRREVAAYNK